ncbi:MAG: Uma2 family endonuclease [Spirosomataceae bacterium]
MTITSLNQLDLNGTYSYADYLKWRLDVAVELIKGKVYKMSPAPSLKHQQVSRQLCIPLFEYFKGKKCQVFNAPFDVRLYDKKKSNRANRDIFTVVQPDICVICDESKLDERGCLGSPDLIIEILSPGNNQKELKKKFELYQECGVKEYWLVYPYEESITQFFLDEDSEKYQLVSVYGCEDDIIPVLFQDLVIDLDDVFETYRRIQKEIEAAEND